MELHVLAVDDSLTDRMVIERLLKVSSCKVTAVDSGTRALQFLGLGLDGEKRSSSVGFDGLKVNMIMTDYSMPGMTGYELLKKIKESSALKEIPVVIMSSENVVARIDRCLEEGAEDFIVKPVKLADVKRLKDSVLRGGEEENKEKEVPSKDSMAGGEENKIEKRSRENEEKETRKRKFRSGEILSSIHSPTQLLDPMASQKPSPLQHSASKQSRL